MSIIKTTVQAVMKRPLILIIIGALMLLGAIANAFIPVIAMIIGIVNMTGGGILESILSLLQMLIDPGLLKNLLILLAVMTLLISLVVGLLLPGYLLVVEDGLSKAEKRRGLFAGSMKSLFFKFFFISVKVTLCNFLLAMFLMVAAVPAIIVTRAVLTSKPDLLVGALFIDFVTGAVLFMCMSFYKIYVYMWYIAASKGEKKPFITGKAVADSQFWSMTMKLLIFDIVFATAIFLIYLSENQMFRYAAGWTFTTVFFTSLSVYLVNAFRNNIGSVVRNNKKEQ